METQHDEVVKKVSEWIVNGAFYDVVQTHMTVGSPFLVEALGPFERDIILNNTYTARGYAKLSGKLLPLTVTISVTISYNYVSIAIGIMRIVLPLEEVLQE